MASCSRQSHTLTSLNKGRASLEGCRPGFGCTGGLSRQRKRHHRDDRLPQGDRRSEHRARARAEARDALVEAPHGVAARVPAAHRRGSRSGRVGGSASVVPARRQGAARGLTAPTTATAGRALRERPGSLQVSAPRRLVRLRPLRLRSRARRRARPRRRAAASPCAGASLSRNPAAPPSTAPAGDRDGRTGDQDRTVGQRALALPAGRIHAEDAPVTSGARAAALEDLSGASPESVPDQVPRGRDRPWRL